ncbi:MAG: ankyrin repeat domain-containing protein, partial [Mycobacterium sp.]
MLDGEKHWLVTYQWRPGGKAWFTPLHQAARHGAPIPVVIELIDRGALSSLRDAKGRTAFDVAAEHDQTFSLPEQLRPPRSTLKPDQIQAFDFHLAEVIDGRINRRVFEGRDLRVVLRYPRRNPARTARATPLVPSAWHVMYGGFHISLRPGIPRGKEFVPRGRRFRPGARDHSRRCGSHRRGIRLSFVSGIFANVVDTDGFSISNRSPQSRPRSASVAFMPPLRTVTVFPAVRSWSVMALRCSTQVVSTRMLAPVSEAV